MDKVFKIITLIVILFAFAKILIRVDVIDESVNFPDETSIVAVKKYDFPKSKTVTLNGTDYLQSFLPVGNFGGQIVLSKIGEGPKTFNVWTSKDATSSSLCDYMFDGLVAVSPYDGQIELKLAKRIEVLPDKKTYNIELRHKIYWSDGVEITADDIEYTWNTIIFGGFGNTSTRDALYIEGKLPTVRKLDKYTVQFVTPKPYAPFLTDLSVPIAPKHVLKPITDKGHNAFNSFWGSNAKPTEFVTSGAFILKEYIPAQRVIFKKNPNYYLINTENKKLPYLDTLVFLIVGDLNNELLKFRAKEIDLIGVRGSDIALFKEQEKYSDYKMYNLGPDTGTMFLTFNLNTRKNDKGEYYVNPIKQKWFNNLNFRKAIDWAIDRDSMIFNIANGAATKLFTPEALSSIYLNNNIAKGHERNLDYAKSLLLSSGFYYNKKGQLFDKDNNKVEFDLLTNAGNTERETLGVMIKQDLQDLGIKVNFKPIEFNNLVNKLVNTAQWDSIILGLTGSAFEPNNGKNVWQSNGALHLFNQRFKKDLKFDDRYPWEKELDVIFDKAALVLDFDGRKKYYDKYQQIVYDNVPIIYLYSPLQVVAIRDKFANIYPSAWSGVVHNISEIYIKEN